MAFEYLSNFPNLTNKIVIIIDRPERPKEAYPYLLY